MRLEVKRWGNGMAVRLPRETPELGRLEEGMILEVHARVVKKVPAWKPATWRSGRGDLSTNHDALHLTDGPL